MKIEMDRVVAVGLAGVVMLVLATRVQAGGKGGNSPLLPGNANFRRVVV